MAINWNDVVSENVRSIVQTVRSCSPGTDVVCVLFDMDAARSGTASPGLQRIIADSELKGGVPILASEGNRLVCLPISTSKMLSLLKDSEEVSDLQNKIHTGGSLVLWAVCFDGEQRICLDIHTHSPEFN